MEVLCVCKRHNDKNDKNFNYVFRNARWNIFDDCEVNLYNTMIRKCL